MPYKKQFIKLTFGGRLAGGGDEWNCGINLGVYGRTGEIPDEVIQTLAGDIASVFDDDIISAFSTFHSSGALGTPAGAVLEYIKLAAIGTNGLYINEPFEFNQIEVAGDNTLEGYIPQVAVVVTLVADKYRDPGKYNRFYYPQTVPRSGAYKYARSSQLAGEVAALLSQLTFNVTSGGTNWTVQPAAVTQSMGGSENYLPIESVRVGNIYDTQRRRRNKLTEIYHEIELADLPEETSEAA